MKKKETRVTIEPASLEVAEFKIVGTSPYVQQRLSAKTLGGINEGRKKAPGTKGKKKQDVDYKQHYLNSMHLDEDGKQGIPCSAFRSAMISACRVCGYVMTKAKMSIFCKGDGLDAEEGTPLVHFKGKPEMSINPVRNVNTNGVSLCARPMWRKWSAVVRIQYDAGQFELNDVANLLSRAGQQVGIGEGRHFSKNSNGLGWGCFDLAGEK